MTTPMTPEEFNRLAERAQEGHYGDESVFHCDLIEENHLHVRRIGDEKDGLAGRVAVMAHSQMGYAVLYFSHRETRQIAEALLTAADELDGATPLQFFPEVYDDPTVDPDGAEE